MARVATDCAAFMWAGGVWVYYERNPPISLRGWPYGLRNDRRRQTYNLADSSLANPFSGFQMAGLDVVMGAGYRIITATFRGAIYIQLKGPRHLYSQQYGTPHLLDGWFIFPISDTCVVSSIGGDLVTCAVNVFARGITGRVKGALIRKRNSIPVYILIGETLQAPVSYTCFLMVALFSFTTSP